MKQITDEKLAERIALLEHAEAETGQLSLHGEAELACLCELRDLRGNKAELQQKLDSESLEKDYNADQISYWKERTGLLQQKLDAMAAENATLRDVLEDIVEPQSSVLEREHRIRAENALKAQATDAYLNSVRAEAVSNFWNKSLRDVAHVLNDIRAFDDSSEAAGIVHSEIKERVDDFVESLRSGTHDTADKAGV